MGTDQIERKAIFDAANIRHWQDGSYWRIFEQLRRAAPIYHCADSAYGPYWSITKYRDILAVETNHEVFSSASEYGGVIIHDEFAAKFANHALEGIITMDPPRHSQQRSAVSGVVARPNLPNFEPTIRKRTIALLDSLPVNEVFDWVEKVSVELATQMLATLFDFPFDDRHKLTHWSNVATSEPGHGVTADEDERIREIKNCLFYFTKLWRERRHKEPGFDFVSMLSQDPNTRDMKPMNFLGNILVLIVGGNDTTRNSMSGAICAFDQFPGEFAKHKSKP